MSETMPVRKITIASLFLILFGGGGLAYVFFQTLPTLGPRWLFFFFFLIGVSGLALPVTAFLNYRFQGEMQVEPHVIIREAIFFGIGADLLAWLQLGRELTATIGVIIATGLVLIEVLLRVSERSRWKPRGEND
jgi:hypothetical protein